MRRRRSRIAPVSFAWIVLLTTVALARPACGEGALDLDHLADALARVEQSHESLETTLRLTVYRSRPVDDGTPWDEAEIASEIELHWIGHGRRFHLSRIPASQDAAAAPDAHAARDTDYVSMWTGESWINQAFARNTVSIYKRPKLNRGVDALALFNGVDFTGIGIGALSHTVRNATLLERSSEGSRHRYVLSLYPANPSRLEMVVDGELEFQLAAATFGFKDSPLNISVSYQVDEWGRYGDLWLPKRARRESIGTPRPDRGPVISRTVYLRLGAETRVDDPPPADIFAPPALAEGTRVVDRAALISYTVGGREMLIDGAVVHTREPITGHPLDEQPELLELSGEASRRPAAAPDRLTYQSRAFGWSIVTGALAFVVTLALLKSIRWVLQRDSPATGRSMLGACLLALAAAVVATFLIKPRAESQPVIVGELVHDFGEHALEHQLDLRHAFVLRNASDRMLHVRDIRTTCGCIDAKTSRAIIEPDESFTVEVTLRIETPRRRTEEIQVDFGADGVQRLLLSGTARRIHDLYAVQDAVLLTPQRPARILLVATNAASNDEPGEPTLRAPAGAGARFEGWRQVLSLDEPSGRAARWQGNVLVHQTAEALPSTARLAIALGSGPEITIDLTGRPWNAIARQ